VGIEPATIDSFGSIGVKENSVQLIGWISDQLHSETDHFHAGFPWFAKMKLRVVQFRGFSKMTLSSLQAPGTARDFIRIPTVEMH
jgi:hypothetical protein